MKFDANTKAGACPDLASSLHSLGKALQGC